MTRVSHNLDAYRLEEPDGTIVTFTVIKTTNALDDVRRRQNYEATEHDRSLVKEFLASRY